MSKAIQRKASRRQIAEYEHFGYSIYGFARALGVSANRVQKLIREGVVVMQPSPWYATRFNINADQLPIAREALGADFDIELLDVWG